MIAADLTLTEERFKVLDFSPPFMSFPVTVLTKLVIMADFLIYNIEMLFDRSLFI